MTVAAVASAGSVAAFSAPGGTAKAICVGTNNTIQKDLTASFQDIAQSIGTISVTESGALYHPTITADMLEDAPANHPELDKPITEQELIDFLSKIGAYAETAKGKLDFTDRVLGGRTTCDYSKSKSMNELYTKEISDLAQHFLEYHSEVHDFDPQMVDTLRAYAHLGQETPVWAVVPITIKP